MAITPDEAYKIDDADKQEITRLTTSIDKYIKDCVRSGRPIWVSGDSFGDDKIIRDAIVSAYQAAGWDVTYQSDQRDGSAYQFTRRAPTSQDFRDSCSGGGPYDR